FRSAKPRDQIVRVQQVRLVHQAVAEVRAGFDFVAQLAQRLDARPDGGAADAEPLRKLGAGHAAVFGGAQGGKNLCVGGHRVHSAKSNPMSTARAEWVSAPTEMKSTPVFAMARTVFKLTPPLASVLARPA